MVIVKQQTVRSPTARLTMNTLTREGGLDDEMAAAADRPRRKRRLKQQSRWPARRTMTAVLPTSVTIISTTRVVTRCVTSGVHISPCWRLFSSAGASLRLSSAREVSSGTDGGADVSESIARCSQQTSHTTYRMNSKKAEALHLFAPNLKMPEPNLHNSRHTSLPFDPELNTFSLSTK